jgi:phage anti-repressor protein
VNITFRSFGAEMQETTKFYLTFEDVKNIMSAYFHRYGRTISKIDNIEVKDNKLCIEYTNEISVMQRNNFLDR